MFIKLTNAAKEHKGNTLILNTKYIISVFQSKDEEGKPITVIYGALKDGWNVEESVDQVNSLLNSTENEDEE